MQNFAVFSAYGSGRISGNITVSRIFLVPSKTCKTRSMPMPQIQRSARIPVFAHFPRFARCAGLFSRLPCAKINEKKSRNSRGGCIDLIFSREGFIMSEPLRAMMIGAHPDDVDICTWRHHKALGFKGLHCPLCLHDDRQRRPPDHARRRAHQNARGEAQKKRCLPRRHL